MVGRGTAGMEDDGLAPYACTVLCMNLDCVLRRSYLNYSLLKRERN